MINVSSNLTLFLKIAFPTMWIVFFGALTIAFFTQDIDYVGPFPIETFRYYFLGFFLTGVLILYWAVMRLKRVDMDKDYMYITNYFISYRYSYSDLEKIEESDYLLFKTIHLHLKQKGKLGKKINFLSSRKRFQNFITEHPEIFSRFLS